MAWYLKIGIENYTLQCKREFFIFTYKYSLYIIFPSFLCPLLILQLFPLSSLVLQLSEFIEEM